MNGVYCGTNASGPSQCVILGNAMIRGSAYGFPPSAAAVRCDDDACMRIANNVMLGNSGVDVYGLVLLRTGTFVDSNTITGGCATASATGIRAENSFARVQNNFVSAGSCNGTISSTPTNRGILVVLSAGPNEMDVHSNTIDGAGIPAPCTGAGVELDVSSSPGAGSGAPRNNIFRAGDCTTNATCFLESDAAGDPRIFESNDLDPYSSPTDLYFDADTSGIDTAAAVDLLLDMAVSGTLSVDPLFVTYPVNQHLQPGSPCSGMGTTAGTPALDFDGQPRSTAAPDIGADEI